MALRRPPTHRVDAPAVYIDPSDDAWDRDRWTQELMDMEKRNKSLREEGKSDDQESLVAHPMLRYFSGDTRFDLDAGGLVGDVHRCPRDYLDESKKPLKIYLRRLSWEQWHEVHGLVRAGTTEKAEEAELLCCRYGVERVENGGGLKLLGSKTGYLEAPAMVELQDVDPLLANRIGNAVWNVSKPLTDDEKKA